MRSSVPHPYVRLAVELPLALVGASLLVWAWRVDPHWFEIHFMPDYFFVTPGNERTARILRLAGAALGLVLLVSARMIGARAGRHSAGRVIGICLPTAAAVYLALVTSEVIQRRHENRVRPDRVEIRMGVSDPRMGWQWRPGVNDVLEVGGRKLLYAFDRLGNRAPTTTADPDLDRATLLVTGESMSLGHGLTYEETFPALVGKRLGLQVANLSGAGYGNDQAYVRLVDQLARFKQPRAVVTFFIPAQLSRNMLDTRPRLELAPDGSLRTRTPRSGLAALLALELLRKRLVPFHSGATIPITRAIFRETDALVRAHGAVPLFVALCWGPVGRTLHEHREEWLLRTFFEDQHLPYVLVDIQDDWRVPIDGHPNQRANQEIADRVTPALQAAGVGTR